ncbi:hypothetical protein BFG52_03115 [Acinetobacter larvae]|uniref:Uncharacterized protein n=1 Tax=Acinetobacter larvae TaxID=1789224 RepID=A0A1B2LWV5_9GAMM|nr:hypothetical protein BFG52_03115 [Acinetobacter larvae]
MIRDAYSNQHTKVVANRAKAKGRSWSDQWQYINEHRKAYRKYGYSKVKRRMNKLLNREKNRKRENKC